MEIEEVNERIEVIVSFALKGIIPIAFKWHNRRYDVTKVASDWMFRQGRSIVHYFTVFIGGPDVYELCYDTENMWWMLTKIYNNT